jgi:hypothetical protein
MLNFYHKQKAKGLPVPHILGLTASPVMRSMSSSLLNIEKTIDAICRTPTKHRAELRLQVKIPVLLHVYHQPLAVENSLVGYTQTIQSLGQAYRGLDILKDPYVIRLKEINSEKSQKQLKDVQMNYKTWCRSEMKTFYSTTLKICRELGGWAADYYVSQVVAKVLKLADEAENTLGMKKGLNAETQYLAKALREVEISRTDCQTPAQMPIVTDKVAKMIEILLQDCDMFSGLIFVQVSHPFTL